MTTRTLKNCSVEFFATSRLARAYRRAIRQNKLLARSAEMHELGHASLTEVLRRDREVEMVVLSHADDDNVVLTKSEVGDVVARAFHVLFTEPATHPGQIAQWMRTTNIRSENRLHVVEVESLEAPQVSDLLGRVCLALGRDETRGSIIDAYLAGDSLLVRGPMHRMLHVPTEKLPSLKGQPRDVLRNFRIDPDGSFIYWPGLDVHLGWVQFLQAVEPAELRKAQQRSADFNRRYGTAIRKLREDAGIPQAKVKGITERQLRRIERGECRATMNALRNLAKAHGLDVNAYVDKVAKAMS